jgi:hypothetical protein
MCLTTLGERDEGVIRDEPVSRDFARVCFIIKAQVERLSITQTSYSLMTQEAHQFHCKDAKPNISSKYYR